jgi:hypothetical protein
MACYRANFTFDVLLTSYMEFNQNRTINVEVWIQIHLSA